MKYFLLTIILTFTLNFTTYNPVRQKVLVPNSNNTAVQGKQDSTKKDNPYKDLRNRALSVTREQIGIKSVEKDKFRKVFGVVIDWGVTSGTATIVAFQTGDASIYFSSGGGYIGGYAHSNVVDAAKKLVEFSNFLLNNAKLTDDTSLPKKDGINFYLLTDNGRYYHREEFDKLIKTKSKWLKLFELANNVINEYRAISPKK